MKKHLLISIATISLLLFSNISFNQTLQFGTLNSFEAYAGVGAVTNSGTATGDAGKIIGILSKKWKKINHNMLLKH